MQELPTLSRTAIDAYDLLSIPVWLFSTHTLQVLASNRAAQAWLGYDATTLESMTIADLRPEEERARIVEKVREFDGTAPDPGVWTIIARSGERFAVSFNWSKVVFEGTEAIVSVAARDASAALSERLHQTLENISDAVFLLDDDWRFSFLNKRAEVTLQRSRDDLLGKNVWQEFPEAVGSTFQTEYERAVTERKTVRFEEFYPPLGAWLEVSAYPTHDGLGVYFRDVTDRHKLDEHLRLLENAVSRQNDILVITEAEPIDGPDGPKIVCVNDAFERRTGYSREEVVGRTPRILQGPKTQRTELDRIRRAMEEWQPVRAELINYTKSGEEFWLELDIVPLADATGRFTHWVSVERDITERRRAEDQLRLAEARNRQSQKLEALGQLTGGVAHDFNNLLAVIIGSTEFLQEELDPSDPLRRHVDMTARAADRAADLTNRLLVFSRKQALQPLITDVNVLIAGLEDMLRRTLGEKLSIAFVLAADPWQIEVDPGQLESALLNLAINSRDAMPDGGSLTVETANARLDDACVASEAGLAAGEYVVVTISDTGHGILPDHIDRVLEPFFTTKRVDKGTGLGLSMVYGFVKQSEGHIRLSSEPGEGTTVKLYFPRARVTAEPLQKSDKVQLEGGGETVLVVEDDPLLLQQVSEQLVGLGYTVLGATNGAGAMDILNKQPGIDLLFTDVVLPGGMNGRQIAEIALKIQPAIKVLYTSGYSENAIGNHGRLDAGVELLSKPYRRKVLAQKLREILDSD